MSRDYLNKKPIYSFNNGGTNPVTPREPVDLTFLKIKIAFAITGIFMMMSLVFLCIASWPWLKSQFL